MLRRNGTTCHIVISPSLIFSAGDDGFTQDLAIIEVDTNKIDATNFIGKAIELGTKTMSRPLSLGCTLTSLTNVLSSTLLTALSGYTAPFLSRCVNPSPRTLTARAT